MIYLQNVSQDKHAGNVQMVTESLQTFSLFTLKTSIITFNFQCSVIFSFCFYNKTIIDIDIIVLVENTSLVLILTFQLNLPYSNALNITFDSVPKGFGNGDHLSLLIYVRDQTLIGTQHLPTVQGH